MNLNFTSPVHPVPAPRPTSFFIEDILLHKPKPLREVPAEHFAGSLASRVPLLDYGYPLMPAPTLLAPHPHPALHKPEHHHHHHPYFLTTSGKCGARVQPEMEKGSSASRRVWVCVLGLRVPALPSPRLRQRGSEISTSRDFEPSDLRLSLSPSAVYFVLNSFYITVLEWDRASLFHVHQQRWGRAGPSRGGGRLRARPSPRTLPRAASSKVSPREAEVSLRVAALPLPSLPSAFLPSLGCISLALIALRVIAPFLRLAEPHLLGRVRMGCFHRDEKKKKKKVNKIEIKQNKKKTK